VPIPFGTPSPRLATALLSLALFGSSAALAQPIERLASEPAGLQVLAAHVSGRVQPLPDGGFRRQWPGTYAEAAFVGSAVYFRVGPGDVSLRVRVDGEAPIALVKPAPGLYRVGVARSGAAHRVRVDVASETQGGATTFGGFFLPAEGRPASLTVRTHQIEFIGDSNTVGYGNTSATRECSGEEVWASTDTSVGVAASLASRYDADYQVNAISGRGLVRNYNGFAADVLPKVYPFVLFDKAAPASDPGWRPQAIVISLGTNDFSTPLNAGEKWTQREQLRADFVAGYASFVRELRQRNPGAYILLWSTGSEDDELATEARKVVKSVQQSGDAKIGFVAVPNLSAGGCHSHPSLADDQAIALALTRHLEAHAPALGKPLPATGAKPAVAAAAVATPDAAASTAARSDGKPTGQLINDLKTATAWGVYGGSTESMPQGGPKDYPMTRVTVAAKGSNPWDVGALSPLSKPVKAGDAVLVAVYLRAPNLKDGESTSVPYFGVNENGPPYTSIAQGAAAVTNQWKVYYASGSAPKAFSPDQIIVGMQLAADRHVVDLGPVLVYNFGQNVDLAKLPR
jgi:lysophospholipase L1-like esterase